MNPTPTEPTDTASTSSKDLLPEITLKGVILSIFLIIILAASNAYLGLKVGTTISASIPAVVIAIGVLRLFRNYNVLEINIVQTAASVGEGLTAGIAFTLPALLILHFWMKFNYWETFSIAATGGILGVFFSIPLRRALLEDKTLKFPEGTAVGEVMKTSSAKEAKLKPIVLGGLVSAIIGFLQNGLKILSDNYQHWFIKGKILFGFGLGFSPAVIAAGYICGINVGISIFIGVIIGWILGVPILSAYYGIPSAGHAAASAAQIWTNYIRYIGVGTMVLAGLWTLFTLSRPVLKGIAASLESLHETRQGRAHTIPRTDRDIPINYVFWGVICLLVLCLLEISVFITAHSLGISKGFYAALIIMDVIYILIAGFIFSSISGYFAALVGSSNSPGSGLLLAALLILSLILLLILGPFINFELHPDSARNAAAFAIIICSFIGASSVLTNESVQIMKAGNIVGATPWKQQLILICGVIVAALVLPLILSLLFNAYGIGGVFPHAGMSHDQMLSAPQAGLMAAVAKAVFRHQLPWGMIITGVIIGFIGIIIDEKLKAWKGLRFPVLAVGLGIYLPLACSIPIFIGGLLSYITERKCYKCHGIDYDKEGHPHVNTGLQNALLLACGIVAGASLIGVILAVPFAIKQSADALRIVPKTFEPIAALLSIIVTLGLCYWIYRVACRKGETA